MSGSNILPLHFLLQKPFSEHHLYHEGGEYISEEIICSPDAIYFKSDCKKCCAILDTNRKLSTNYYIGADWLNKGVAIYVEPKLNQNAEETDYLQMLFSALSHPDIVKHTQDLYEIKWDKKYISINSQQDLLTPLLVVQFLRVIQEIVRKGLKKSYYRVEQNLNGKVKGKILVGKTIKQNLLKNKSLNTYCTFDEFGVNGLENRLLKKALVFVQRYLPTLKIPNSEKYTTEVFNYIMPAFDLVSEEVNLNDIKHSKTNAFYKEYAEGIRLAKLILKRFGYNITNTQQTTILTPPFWIDMSKLFELYVWGLMIPKYGSEVEFQFQSNYGKLDYLLTKQKIIVDAKYKTYYNVEFKTLPEKRKEKVATDIRQISGYARDTKVLLELGKSKEEQLTFVPECLIIYPILANDSDDHAVLIDIEAKTPITEFVGFYKLSVKIPVMKDLVQPIA
jgi:5-methylcytosine-specific restriction enzyme subunit McrC